MALKQWKPKQMHKDVTIIGAAILDVLAGPVSEDVFVAGSQSMKSIRLSFGGDALNEAVALAKLGISTELVSKVGYDETGERVLAYLKQNDVSVEHVIREEGLDTGVNIVLIDKDGERHFLTNPEGSLRKLTIEDVMPHLSEAADIVSFASMFVSPLLGVEEMENLFAQIKSKPGRILVADMTKAKNGETLEEIKRLLPYIDYLQANEEEIALLTGISDTRDNAELLIKAGAECAIIKRGSKGCLIRTKEACVEIPAYPVKRVVDTTGAGDCFAAGFLWGLSRGLTLEECGRLACATASFAVESMGATEGIHSATDVEKRMNFYRIE